MIYVYFFILFVAGLSTASLGPFKHLNISARMALAPFLSILPAVLILYFENFVGIPLTRLNLLLPWGIISLTVFLGSKEEIFNIFKCFEEVFLGLTKKQKAILGLITLGLIGFIARATVEPIWEGDGREHWGPKALEWVKFQKIHYGEEILPHIGRWVSYPLLHKLTMAINVLTFSSLPAYSIKLFDSYFYMGLIFSCTFFFRAIGWTPFYSLLGGMTAMFVQKEFLELVMAGYAEIDMAYYLFLGLVLTLNGFNTSEKNRTKYVSYFMAGLLFGAMVITKNEGIYRVVLIMLGLHVFFRKPLTGQAYAFLLVPIIFFFAIDKISIPTDINYNEYTAFMDFSLENLQTRIPIILKAMFYAFRPIGLIKCFWIATFLLTFLTFTKAKKEDWDTLPVIKLFLLIFLLNWVFNHIPSLLSDVSNSPEALAKQVIGRIHLHVSTLLTVIAVMGIGPYYKEIKQKSS